LGTDFQVNGGAGFVKTPFTVSINILSPNDHVLIWVHVQGISNAWQLPCRIACNVDNATYIPGTHASQFPSGENSSTPAYQVSLSSIGYLSGLSSGTHTIDTYMCIDGATPDWYFAVRPVGNPLNEMFRVMYEVFGTGT
jgi:hypothetical protein